MTHRELKEKHPMDQRCNEKLDAGGEIPTRPDSPKIRSFSFSLTCRRQRRVFITPLIY
jgi:hypothetical protein